MSSEPIPNRQRWATATARPMGEIASIPTPLLRRGNPTAVVGGKLAAALVPRLLYAGFEGVVTERRHPLLAGIPHEAAEYEVFGSSYGEIHSARAFRQLVERAARSFTPRPDRRHEGGVVIDPFRPGLHYPATSDREFEVQGERHLNAVRSAFRRARTLLVVLSSSEVWENAADGAVYPHWADHGERLFDAEAHRIRTLTLDETVADLKAAITALRGISPALEVVLMVSPEPQPATALPVHVLAAGALGKAVLRIAMETVSGSEGVHYFPAYEIASLIAPTNTYDADGTPPEVVSAAVAEALVEISEAGRVSYDGATAPISVIKPSEAAVVKAADQAPAQQATPRPKRPPQAQAVDAFSEAEAAKKAERKAKLVAKRAARELAGGGEAAAAQTAERARKIAEIKARQQEKIAAREAKRAEKRALGAAVKEPAEPAETKAATGLRRGPRRQAQPDGTAAESKPGTGRRRPAQAAATGATEGARGATPKRVRQANAGEAEGTAGQAGRPRAGGRPGRERAPKA